MRKLIFAVCLLSSSVCWGANFSGKWSIRDPGRGARRNETVLMLNQADGAVIGTASDAGDVGTGSPVNNEIYDPKVEGDTISFYVWRGTDEPAKLYYKGTMTSPNEIKFQVTGGPLRQGVGLSSGVSVPSISRQVTAIRTH